MKFLLITPSTKHSVSRFSTHTVQCFLASLSKSSFGTSRMYLRLVVVHVSCCAHRCAGLTCWKTVQLLIITPSMRRIFFRPNGSSEAIRDLRTIRTTSSPTSSLLTTSDGILYQLLSHGPSQWRIQDLQTGGQGRAPQARVSRHCPLPRKFLTSSAFWALFFAVQLPIVQARNTAFGLTKLAAAACMQCTAQRQQKAANTSLLESRNLLQTATLVFQRPIVCSRLSNKITILAKKLSGRQRGAMAPRPWAGSATGHILLV